MQIHLIKRVVNNVVLTLYVYVDCQRRKNVRMVQRLLNCDFSYNVSRKASCLRSTGILVENPLLGHNVFFVFLVKKFSHFSVRATADSFHEFQLINVVNKITPFHLTCGQRDFHYKFVRKNGHMKL
jgi:N-acyl-D-aspartate/D-glutamate deacylase